MRHLLIVLMILIPLSGWSQSYIEETTTLESIYESQARTVLNTLLRPDEYSIIVSAEISRDQEKIKRYQDQLESEVLPGMPVHKPELADAANELNDLKSSVTIHLVLNKEIPEEKEKLIYQVLSSKLHLDITLGDKIVIQRSSFPSEKKRMPAAADPLPEPTWKLMLLMGGLGILLLLITWMLIRKKKKETAEAEAKDPLIPAPQFEMPVATENSEAFDGDLMDVEVPEGVSDHLLIEKIESHKAEVLQLAEEYPHLMVRAAVEYFKSGKELETLILMKSIGWDEARRLFRNLPENIWGQLGTLLEKRGNEDWKLPQIAQAVADASRSILSHVLAFGKYGDHVGPFNFLYEAKGSVRRSLLNGESDRALAIIGFCSDDDEFFEIVNDLDPQRRQQVIAAATEIESLQEVEVNRLVEKLMSKMENMQDQGELNTDGIAKAVKILRLLPPDQEDEIFNQIAVQSPGKAEKMREKMVRFSDLPLYPQEVLSNVLAEYEIDQLVTALAGGSEDFVNSIVGLMPPKKAKVVRADLSYRTDNISSKMRSEVQRDICLQVEKLLLSNGSSVDEVWQNHKRAN